MIQLSFVVADQLIAAAMESQMLDYASPKRRRRIAWYHWVPLAVLVLLLVFAAVSAWQHWNDQGFWDS